MNVFSQKLKQLRFDVSKNQTDIADYLGVSVQSYSAYEAGREPKYEMLCMLADYFGCTIDYLLGRTEYKNAEEKLKFTELQDTIEKAMNQLSVSEQKTLLNIMYAISESVLRNSEDEEYRAIYLYNLSLITQNMMFLIMQSQQLTEEVSKLGEKQVYEKLDSLSTIVFRNIMWKDAAVKAIEEIFTILQERTDYAKRYEIEKMAPTFKDEYMQKHLFNFYDGTFTNEELQNAITNAIRQNESAKGNLNE